MATNPRVPEQNERSRRGPALVPKPEPPSSAVPGVALAIVTSALILAAIIYFMPRAPKSAVAPAGPGAITPNQPVNDQLGGPLHVSALKMSVAPTGGAINLNGQLTNSGSTIVNGVMAEIDFTLNNGQTAAVQAPVQGIATDQSANTNRVAGDTSDLTQTPIKPGDTRPVRLTVNQVPKDWNHQLPQIRISETTGTTR